jgi:hypothetical protein
MTMSLTLNDPKRQDATQTTAAGNMEQQEFSLCCYVNATSKIQIARISNIPQWYFERVVFPGQRLMFEAPATGRLEIHTGQMSQAILADTIPCDRLQVEC